MECRRASAPHPESLLIFILSQCYFGFSFDRLAFDPGNWNSPSRRKAFPELASNAQAVSVTGCAGNWSAENHTCHVSDWSRFRHQASASFSRGLVISNIDISPPAV